MALRVTNIVVTCNINCAIHLPILVTAYPFCEWNKKKFAALTLRFRHPKTTCLVFASGRLVCTGGRTMDHARLSVLQTCVMIKNVGYSQAVVRSFKVQNIASAFRYSQDHLNLEKLFEEYPAQTSYEPELFPALVFRPRVKGVVFLVFESGRVVITGSRSREAVVEAHATMVGLLNNLTGAKRPRVVRVT